MATTQQRRVQKVANGIQTIMELDTDRDGEDMTEEEVEKVDAIAEAVVQIWDGLNMRVGR